MPGGAIDQLALLFQLLNSAQTVPVAETTALVTDAGTTALSTITQTTELANGVAADVTELCTITDVEATTTGIGVLAVDVGVAGAAIAPALGVLAGVGLYELAPDFWQSIADQLIEAGETIGGKVRAFINGDDETIGLSENAIEIYKEAFREVGLFDTKVYQPDDSESLKPSGYDNYELSNPLTSTNKEIITISNNWKYDYKTVTNDVWMFLLYLDDTGYTVWFCSRFSDRYIYQYMDNSQTPSVVNLNLQTTFNNKPIYYNTHMVTGQTNQTASIENILSHGNISQNYINDFIKWVMYNVLYGSVVSNLQDGAIIPDTNPFPQTYPTWTPYTLPDEQTKVYPLTMPVQNPNPTQQPSQNPDPLTDPGLDLQSILDWLLDNFPLPTPGIQPQPVPEPDPDPQPEPEPIPEPQPEPTPSNPPNPNPDPGTPPLPVVPDLPSAVPANAMFTVYAPTIAQVNSFGGWLWSSSIIEQIKRIWNNPLDGIISFMKVYAVPTTGGSDTIKVGVLDSGVSSAVVTSQFVTVECGTINIREKFYNATDYSPFVGLHLYLPFIGIVELDCDEFMSGSITVTYHIDVYTGTCLAEVKATRNYDMPQATIVYTFSGNASQQLPLTSAEFSGALSALVGVVGGGLAIASGGGLGLLAGASGIAHAVTHEMVHIAHSGSLSANAGIMGARKPFLILTRRRSYDANGYNQLYGYPSNKTVYLANCSGYVKVKDIQLKTGATEKENAEIVSLLKSGVIM